VLKVLLLLGALGALLGGGGGTLAARLQPHGAKVSQVAIALGKPGRANQLNVPGVGLAAGDTMQRPFDLKNAGKVDFTAVTLTTTASPSSTLDTDPSGGLHIQLDSCPKKWTQVKKSPTYTCKGAIASVLALRPVLGTNVVVPGLAHLKKKKTVHLLMTIVLPASAPNSVQGQTSTLTYTFTAI
jgi:spore coat-associated protein N